MGNWHSHLSSFTGAKGNFIDNKLV